MNKGENFNVNLQAAQNLDFVGRRNYPTIEKFIQQYDTHPMVISTDEEFHFNSVKSYLKENYDQLNLKWKRISTDEVDIDEDEDDVLKPLNTNINLKPLNTNIKKQQNTPEQQQNSKKENLYEEFSNYSIEDGVWISIFNMRGTKIKWKNNDQFIEINNENDDLLSNCSIYFTQDKEERAIQIFEELRKFRAYSDHSSELNKINIVISNDDGLKLIPQKIKKPVIDLNKNYNDDFIPVHEKITKELNTNKNTGIVLLHGPPGTGKTSYIRYLLGILKKKIIYIPPSFTHMISDPSFIEYMVEWSNSVLIIEDAENVIGERRGGDNQSVSNLLNLADGILADCMNIQIVCTFNKEKEEIDDALLRKGRLITEYKFKELEMNKAKKLAQEIGADPQKIDKDLPLSEIYNSEEDFYKEQGEEKSIGFKKKE